MNGNMPMPPAKLTEKPGHLIRRAQQIAVALFMDECQRFDLTPVQYAALAAIREFPGIDATRLAGQIAFDRPTIGGVLERLEAKGLISRTATPADRRVKPVWPTPQGEALLALAEPAVEQAQDRILEKLPKPERAQLMALLAKLVDLNNGASRAPRQMEPKRKQKGS